MQLSQRADLPTRGILPSRGESSMSITLPQEQEPHSLDAIEGLRAAIDEGDASGVAEDSSLEGVLAEVRSMRAGVI